MLNLKWPVSMFALFNHFCLFPGDNFKSPTTQPGQWGWGRGWWQESPPSWPNILTSGKFYCKTLQVVNWLHQLKMLRQFFALLPDKVGLSRRGALYRTMCHWFTTSQICPQKPCFIILSLYLKFVIFVDSPKSAGDKYQVCLSYLYCDNK